MKLTWFSGTTLRIHIGGRILVADPVGISGVDAEELVSGADLVFDLGDLPLVDPAKWQPRRPPALIDEPSLSEVRVHGLAGGSALVDAVGEPPLLLLAGGPGDGGRWSRDAVVVAFTEDAAATALSVLAPRLIALALPDALAEAVFVRLRERLQDTALVVLEPGMALEV